MQRLHRRAALVAALWVLAAAGSAQGHEYKLGTLVIHHPWSAPVAANAEVAAGYMEIINTGQSDDRLVAATADISTACQIHEMKMAGGVMTMNEMADGLVIPAGGRVVLAPGGYHIMLMGVKKPPPLKAKFGGTLTFARAGTVDITYFVQEAR